MFEWVMLAAAGYAAFRYNQNYLMGTTATQPNVGNTGHNTSVSTAASSSITANAVSQVRNNIGPGLLMSRPAPPNRLLGPSSSSKNAPQTDTGILTIANSSNQPAPNRIQRVGLTNGVPQMASRIEKYNLVPKQPVGRQMVEPGYNPTDVIDFNNKEIDDRYAAARSVGGSSAALKTLLSLGVVQKKILMEKRSGLPQSRFEMVGRRQTQMQERNKQNYFPNSKQTLPPWAQGITDEHIKKRRTAIGTNF